MQLARLARSPRDFSSLAKTWSALGEEQAAAEATGKATARPAIWKSFKSDHLERARVLLEAGDEAGARQEAKRAGGWLADAKRWQNIAWFYERRLSDPAAARDALLRAEKKCRKLGEFLSLASTLEHRGDPAGAERCRKSAAARVRNNGERLVLGSDYLKRGQPGLARPLYLDAEKRAVKEGCSSLLHIAEQWRWDWGDQEAARRCIRLAEQKAETNWHWEQVAKAYLTLLDDEEGAAAARRMISTAPEL